jgi:hypothetical protein
MEGLRMKLAWGSQQKTRRMVVIVTDRLSTDTLINQPLLEHRHASVIPYKIQFCGQDSYPRRVRSIHLVPSEGADMRICVKVSSSSDPLTACRAKLSTEPPSDLKSGSILAIVFLRLVFSPVTGPESREILASKING